VLAKSLLSGAAEIGVDLSADQVHRFLRYLDLLREWNQKFNLTAIKDEQEIISKHFLDSILLGCYVPKHGSLADVGSGAGFPGIPLKILYPELQITLIDSVGKRVNFLREVIAELGLTGVEAVHGRAEDLGRNSAFRDRFDIVVARAVSRLSVLSEYCLPLVKTGGLFLAAKGPNVEQEVEECTGALAVLGGRLDRVERTTLPGKNDVRTVVLVIKIMQTPTQYPRKAGVPERKPLPGT